MTWYNPPSGEPEKSIKNAGGTDKTQNSANGTEKTEDCNIKKSWLEALPSRSGTALAAILAEVMTEGLTPNQENILGNFIASVAALILYKAARDD